MGDTYCRLFSVRGRVSYHSKERDWQGVSNFMLRIILVGISIIISYVFQTTFSMKMSFGVVSPNIIMILVCGYALLRGKKEGLIVGFFAGFLVDLFFGYYEVIGINAFLYMMIGYIVGIFHDIWYLQDILIPVTVVAISDFMYNFVTYVITFLLRNRLDLFHYVKAVIMPEIIYTVFLTVFIYRIMMLINKKLEEFEMRGNEEID